MHRRRLLIGAAILASVLAVGAVACDDDEDDGNGDAVATPTVEIPSDGDLDTPTTAADETPGAAAEPIDIVINPVGDSGVSGTATMDTDGTLTLVLVEISAGLEEGTMHQSHIHHGNCTDPTGEIHVNLNNIEGQADGSGTATTEDPEALDGSGTPTFDHWTASEHYIAVHAADGTVIGCGDVLAAS